MLLLSAWVSFLFGFTEVDKHVGGDFFSINLSVYFRVLKALKEQQLLPVCAIKRVALCATLRLYIVHVLVPLFPSAWEKEKVDGSSLSPAPPPCLLPLFFFSSPSLP